MLARRRLAALRSELWNPLGRPPTPGKERGPRWEPAKAAGDASKGGRGRVGDGGDDEGAAQEVQLERRWKTQIEWARAHSASLGGRAQRSAVSADARAGAARGNSSRRAHVRRRPPQPVEAESPDGASLEEDSGEGREGAGLDGQGADSAGDMRPGQAVPGVARRQRAPHGAAERMRRRKTGG